MMFSAEMLSRIRGCWNDVFSRGALKDTSCENSVFTGGASCDEGIVGLGIR